MTPEQEMQDIKGRLARLESEMFLERARRIPPFQIIVDLGTAPKIVLFIITLLWVCSALALWVRDGMTPVTARLLYVAPLFVAGLFWFATRSFRAR
jgi:hypothetical protein